MNEHASESSSSKKYSNRNEDGHTSKNLNRWKRQDSTKFLSKPVRKTLQNYLTLQNGSFIRWLKRHNYQNIAVFLPKIDDLSHLFIDELIASQETITVSLLITNEKQDLSFDSHPNPNSWKIVSCTDTKRIKDAVKWKDVDVIVTDPGNIIESAKRAVGVESAAKVVTIHAIIRELLHYESQYPLIERLYGLRVHGIYTLVVEMPVADDVANPSEWEQFVVKSKRWFNELIDGKNFNEYLQKLRLDPKYTADLFKNGSMSDSGQITLKDYQVRADHRSKHINIINHIRAATDIPADAKHDVHIVTDSTGGGPLIMDEDTVGSFLQRCMNRIRRGEGGKVDNNRGGGSGCGNVGEIGYHSGNSDGEGQYAALIYPGFGIGVDVMQRRLRDIVVKSGDIVVVMASVLRFRNKEFGKSCEENGVPVYSMQANFDRPHDLGEVFYDYGHLNSNGNRRIGEVLYYQLFVHPTKLPVPPTCRHYFSDGSVLLANVQTAESVPLQMKDITVQSEFAVFLRELETYRNMSQVVGAVVMNCNPFTLGHLHLVETAASQVDMLFVFVVEEDLSEFPFADRFELVKMGTLSLSNVVVMPSSKFIISSVTLPEYFVKGEKQDVKMDTSMDVDIFCRWVAPALGISIRFVGEEPTDRVTQQYNSAMQETLPKYGITLQIIPRKKSMGTHISASVVRALLKEKRFKEIAGLVPSTTLTYLKKRYGVW